MHLDVALNIVSLKKLNTISLKSKRKCCMTQLGFDPRTSRATI